MTTDLDAQQPVCVFCLVGECDLCTGRDGTRWCQHLCEWMTR